MRRRHLPWPALPLAKLIKPTVNAKTEFNDASCFIERLLATFGVSSFLNNTPKCTFADLRKKGRHDAVQHDGAE